MCIGLHMKYSLLWSDFNKTLIFSAYFSRILKYQILWRQTDRHDKANGRFSQFCERARKKKSGYYGNHIHITVGTIVIALS